MRRIIQRATLLQCVVVPLLAERLDAQTTSAAVAISGGVATDQRGIRSNALVLAPGVAFAPSQHVSVTVGGNVTRFGNDAHSLGAGASVLAQESIGRLAYLTLTANAGASRLGSATPVALATADVMPAIELRVAPVAVFAGVRAATGSNTQSTPQSTVPLPSPRAAATSTTRGAGPSFGGTVTLGGEANHLRIAAREDRMRVAGETAAERSLGAALTVALTAAASLEIGAGRYDANRLLGTPSGEYVSAGIVWRFGGNVREPSLPRAAGAPRSAGTTRLSIRAPAARRVEIAGDFNDWTPAAANRAANGVWYADLRIPPGQYRYAFRVDGKEWRVPDGATAVDDGFGGKSAWLTVSDARSQ